jgi:hypothetical protein
MHFKLGITLFTGGTVTEISSSATVRQPSLIATIRSLDGIESPEEGDRIVEEEQQTDERHR